MDQKPGLGVWAKLVPKSRRHTEAIILLIIGVAIIDTIFVGVTTDLRSRTYLEGRASTVATALGAENIKALNGDKSDLTKPSYVQLKQRLSHIKQENDDLRFVYLMGKQGNKVFFYADSENPSDVGYSPPGDVYDNPSARLSDAFQSFLPFTEGPMRDKWGAWVSGLAPVVDPKTNKVLAVAGIDIAAQNYYYGIATTALVPLLLAAIPVAGLLRDRKVQRKEWEIANLKNQFVSVASHELRSPLSGMLWAEQSLLKPDVDNLTAQQKSLVQDMYRSTNSSMATVNEILDLSIFERGKKMKHETSTIDLVDIVHDVQKTLNLGAQERNIDVIMAQTWPNTALTVGNMAALRRALMNVVSNAIKYSPESSTITVSYRTEDRQHIIGVLDRGIGIPKEEQAKVLGGYYRAANATKMQSNGTGIGLFLTKLIVEEHHGKVWIESEEGRGTSVFVSLPITTGEPKPSPVRTKDQA